MKFIGQINARAKEIRREAAARFGGVETDYDWKKAVSLACEGFEFVEIKSVEERILECSSIMKWNVWEKGNIRRIYINLKGDRSYRGDNTFKLYLEGGEVKQAYGKGLTSRKFDESLEDFNAYVEAIRNKAA